MLIVSLDTWNARRPIIVNFYFKLVTWSSCIDNDYAFVCFGKNFYAGCPSCRNSPHLSGLRTGIKKHRNVPPMAGFYNGAGEKKMG